jgi:predicted metal-binding membrane protein
MFWPRAHDRRLFTALLVALVVLAWLALWVWDLSPYGRFLSHEQLADVEIGFDGEALLFGLFFVAGWTLMTFAMMLPTSLPLVQLFQRLTRQRPNPTRLVVLLIAGYLSVWVLFGVVAHIGDRGLHELVELSAWLEANAWMLGAGTLLMAGAYQFTPLKYHCLDKCRSPLSFITEHWLGNREQAQAFRLGVHHGIFCVGCCWSLMLLMFAVGVGNVGWMLALGTVMAVEKNMSWGRRLSAPLGVGLIAGGLVLILVAAQDVCAVHIDCG